MKEPFSTDLDPAPVVRFFHLTIAPPAPPTAAEEFLRSLSCKFKKKKGGIMVVAGDLDLSSRNLIELPDLSSVIVKGNFYCLSNKLTSLKGAPQSVDGDFNCCGNQLTSLTGGPRRVGGRFHCSNNPLTNLEHAPQEFGTLWSDFGAFNSWARIPEEIKYSPETRKRNFTAAATVLQQKMKIGKPLQLKRQPSPP